MNKDLEQRRKKKKKKFNMKQAMQNDKGRYQKRKKEISREVHRKTKDPKTKKFAH